MGVLSNMLALGTTAPEFSLTDGISDKTYALAELKSDIATVIMFICNHCPYVIHVVDKLSEISAAYQKKGIHFIAINSNDVERYPADAPDKMQQFSKKHQLVFPYLYDQSQVVAQSYQAACTPEFYVFDENLSCVYRGQFDDSRPSNNILVSGESLKNALDQILAGKPVDHEQKPSIGCSIKWKEG